MVFFCSGISVVLFDTLKDLRVSQYVVSVESSFLINRMCVCLRVIVHVYVYRSVVVI